MVGRVEVVRAMGGEEVFGRAAGCGESRAGHQPMTFRSGKEENWVIVMKPGATDSQIHSLCSSGRCLVEGRPDEGGMPYFEV